jgi:hypothetical protein
VSLSLASSLTSPSSLAQVFCAFPCLRKLSILGSISLISDELSSATTFQLPPDLNTFELQSLFMHTTLEWLLSLPVRPALRTVRLHYLQDRDLAMFHKFIGALGNNLESLSLCTYLEGN